MRQKMAWNKLVKMCIRDSYDTYDVIQVSGARVVIGVGATVTAAVNAANLRKV